MASPHDVAEQYALVTRHLILREYAAACTSLAQLLADVPRASPALAPSPRSDQVDLAASGSSTNVDSLASWSDVGAEGAEAGGAALRARWDGIDGQTLRALKLAVTVYTSVFAGLRDGARRGSTGLGGSGRNEAVERLPSELRDVVVGPAAGIRPLFAYIVRQCIGVLAPPSPSQPSSPSRSGYTASSSSSSSPPAPLPLDTLFHETPLAALPPALLVTLVLAALKLAPPLGAPLAASTPSTHDAVATARDVVEAWLAQVPDGIVLRWTRGEAGAGAGPEAGAVDMSASHASLGSTPGSSSSDSDPASAARQGALGVQPPASAPRADHRADYLKLIELYVLELLPRQGDWDAAADWVRSDGVIGAKRREFMFRRLHAARAKVTAAQAQSSARDSGASGAGSAGAAGSSASATSPRRGSTASSSESELTARPGDVLRRQIGGAAPSGRQQGALRAAQPSGLANAESSASSAGRDPAMSAEEPTSVPVADKGKARDPAERPTSAAALTGFAALRARLSEFISAANARDLVSAAPASGAGRPSRNPLALAWGIVAGRPYTVLVLVFVALAVRRAIARRRPVAPGSLALAATGAGTTARANATGTNDTTAVQARIRQQLADGAHSDWTVQAGNMAWTALRKVRETIRMGTKITYV